LDCLFLPYCGDWRSFSLSLEQARGLRSDSRYLTQSESAAVVMPTDSRPPIVVVERGEASPWVPDARPVGRGDEGGLWSAAMVEALLEAGMERARIGVVGLQHGRFTHARARTGVVDHGSYAAVRARLPNATFVDATDTAGRARYVKSDEEIAC